MAIRVLKDPELRSARDDFKLKSFHGKTSEQRRNVWFKALDDVSRGLRGLHGEEASPELLAEALVELLATALHTDEALAAWMTKRTDPEWRANVDNWRRVERACAGVIVQDYLSACDDGRWPPATDD
jgi:hypothetical protein